MPVVNMNRGAPFDVYIGRPGRGVPGPFGNPIVRGRPCRSCGQVHATNGSTLPCYRRWLEGRIFADPDFAQAVRDLDGKRLGCPCGGQAGACHGDVLLEVAARLRREGLDGWKAKIAQIEAEQPWAPWLAAGLAGLTGRAGRA